MQIRVQLYAMFARFAPGAGSHAANENFSIDLADGSTVQDALAALALPPDVPKFVFVNRRRVHDLTVPLGDGDEMGVFPPIAGGGRPPGPPP